MKVGALWLKVGQCNRIQKFLYDFSQYFTILNSLCNAFPFHTIHSHLFGSSLLFSAFSKTFQKRIHCVAMNSVYVYISHIYTTLVYTTIEPRVVHKASCWMAATSAAIFTYCEKKSLHLLKPAAQQYILHSIGTYQKIAKEWVRVGRK